MTDGHSKGLCCVPLTRTFNYFNKLLVLAGGVLISLHMEFRLLSMSDYLQGVVN